jgi:PAS domain S-box-containing protein
LRSKAGQGFLAFLLLALILSAAIGAGYYHSSLAWFEINKTEEKLTALQLVDAFIAEYADVRSTFNRDELEGAPVPASFRAHAIDRFNRARVGDDQLRLVMVGAPGREILIPPSDTSMADAIRNFAASVKPTPEISWVAVGGQPMFRSIYPSIASQQSCVDCHNHLQAGREPWRLNDVMGALVIDVPVGPFLRRILTEAEAVAIAAFIVTTLLGFYIFALHFRQLAQREASEAAVRASELRFRDFAETASDWYWETDRQHCFTYLSDRLRAFGADPRDYIGRDRLSVAKDTRDAEKWADHRATLDRHEPFREFVYHLHLGDNRTYYVASSGKPIFGSQGEFLGYRGCAQNVTERVLGEEQLRAAKTTAEAANRSKSEFLANMSHELRTPLNAIIGFADIMAKGLFGPIKEPRYVEYARDIAASGGNLLAIINDILDMSKIEAGRHELREDSINIEAVLTSCRRLIEPRALEADITLECTILPGVPLVRGDELRLKQILLNVLGNAVKFTPPGGRVSVTWSILPGGDLQLAVSDTGIGMTEDQIALALQPFRQVDSSFARKSQGTGLGLPLVKAFTELHDGRLRIHSVPNSGTTVLITLPAHRVEKFEIAVSPLG